MVQKPKKTHAESVEERARALERARASIDADPAAAHTMLVLARIAFMSVWYFQHRFRVAYGIPPGEYVTRARFALMCHLLETTDLPIALVAVRAGYRSFGSCSASFARRIGCHPSAYRRWVRYAAELDDLPLSATRS